MTMFIYFIFLAKGNSKMKRRKLHTKFNFLDFEYKVLIKIQPKNMVRPGLVRTRERKREF